MNDYTIDMEELNPSMDDILYAEDPKRVARSILEATGAYEFTPSLERDWKRWRGPIREDEILSFGDIGHRFSTDNGDPLHYMPGFLEEIEDMVLEAYKGNKKAKDWLSGARRNLGLSKK